MTSDDSLLRLNYENVLSVCCNECTSAYKAADKGHVHCLTLYLQADGAPVNAVDEVTNETEHPCAHWQVSSSGTASSIKA